MSALIHLQPVVRVLAGPFQPDPRSEITSLSYTTSGLKMTVEAAATRTDVVFPIVWGFRVLDELDLTEFWTKCSMKTGWLFEVTGGGWKALELQRAHFVSGRIYEDIREFLVLGLDVCVSVLSRDDPQLHTTSN